MSEIHVIKEPITRAKLKKIAEERFGDLVKAAVDIRQSIMAVGGELHIDEEVFLIEKCDSRGVDVWGINLYPNKPGNEMIEFDSIINIKPSYNNRSRGVEDPVIKERIIEIVDKLILD